MKTIFIFTFIFALLAIPAQSQDEKPIQDNSFLLEEAYNQEDGVVQHITTAHRDWRNNQWAFSFTQEWPVFGQKNQFSYTLEGMRFPGSGAHIGDTALNWRYQLYGNGESKVAVSPRFSLLLPTGDSDLGRGAGALGYEFNLPVSVQHNRRLVTHWNAGFAITPDAKNPLREKARTTDATLAQSFIFLAHPRFNLMLETVYDSLDTVTGPGRTLREHGTVLNPGVRWAHNFASGLQIVPGVSFPMGVAGASQGRGIFFYLSFEHPFTRKARQ